MRAKYTHRTKLRFMLCVFRDCIEPSPSRSRAIIRSSYLRRRWLFRIRFASRPLSLPGSCQRWEDALTAHLSSMTSGLPCDLISYSPARFPRKRIRKTHTRPAMFCRNHLAIRFDDPAELPAALSARKRAYARNRSPKVALAGKTLLQPTITARKTAQKWTF